MRQGFDFETSAVKPPLFSRHNAKYGNQNSQKPFSKVYNKNPQTYKKTPRGGIFFNTLYCKTYLSIQLFLTPK
jgi:hypothetical protein